MALQDLWLAVLHIGAAKKFANVRALMLLGLRSILLERNGRVFRSTVKPAERFLDEIMAEVERWKTVRYL